MQYVITLQSKARYIPDIYIICSFVSWHSRLSFHVFYRAIIGELYTELSNVCVHLHLVSSTAYRNCPPTGSAAVRGDVPVMHITKIINLKHLRLKNIYWVESNPSYLILLICMFKKIRRNLCTSLWLRCYDGNNSMFRSVIWNAKVPEFLQNRKKLMYWIIKNIIIDSQL